ncbi:MAG TPA: hypothetical protein VK665_15915 [Candidatus Elarobacter sp.]|nr:hypothetical protein [Candidatus Elarobacter sp.]
MEHSNLGVRRLLRKIRYPGLLERDHLATTIRDASGAPNARDAVIALLDDVLRRYPPIYWTIIERVDLEGKPTRTVAGELYLSYRTLHRYRSAAIATLADALERRFGAGRAAPPSPPANESDDVPSLLRAGYDHLRQPSVRSFDAAKRCFTRALELDENCVEAWTGLASCYEHQSAHLERDAIASFDASVRAFDRASQLRTADSAREG